VGIAPDRYDELRREWIHNHWTWSEIQRARMEKLDIQIRRRYAAMILAAPSRRDDLARNPLPARGHASTIGQIEWAAFWIMLALAILSRSRRFSSAPPQRHLERPASAARSGAPIRIPASDSPT
jgi:hypothetical protein